VEVSVGTPQLKAAIYARYSSEHQREASIEDQVRNCRRYAKEMKMAILEDQVYADHAVSGLTVADRAEFNKMLATAMGPDCPFNTILVDDTSRLSRDGLVPLQTIRRLRVRGISIVFVSQHLDGANEDTDFMVQIHSAMDNRYSKELGDKTRRDLEGRVLAGHHAGGRLYGYHTKAVEDVSRLDPHGKPKVTGYEIYITPEEAPTVRRIFESYLAGTSPRAIAAQLNAEGIPNSAAKGRKNRHAWSGSTIATMLDNPKYMGDWTWNKTRWVRDPDTGKKRPLPRPEREWVHFFNEHLAIIDKPTWEAVQARRKHLKTKYTHTRATQPQGKKGTLRGLKGQPGYGKYLLSGLLTCGVCGHAMIVADSPVRRLTCGAHRDKGSAVCPNGASIRMDFAEKAILDRVEAEVLTNEAMDRIVDKVLAKFAALPDLEPKRQGELLQRKRQLEGEVANLVAFVARGNDMEEVEQAIRQAKAQVKVIDQELDLQQARAQRKVNPPTRNEIKKALRSYRKLIRAEAPRANLALKALLGKIEMHPKGKGRAVSYVARCNIKLGEILLPSVSTYGSGERV